MLSRYTQKIPCIARSRIQPIFENIRSNLTNQVYFYNQFFNWCINTRTSKMYITTTSSLFFNKTSGNENNEETTQTDRAKQSNKSNWILDSEVKMIPHPEKRHKGGEDAYVVSKNGKMLGIFDGVGGWAEVGVDPRDYAIKLSEGFQKAADEYNITDPKQALHYAYNYAKSVVGSSTACVVSLLNDTLHSANVGDSGFMVIRPPDDMIFRSEEQQHTFNQPYQLGFESSDTPDSAECHKINVKEGDIVILCTDGVLDNLDDDRIVELVKIEYTKSGDNMRLDRLAESISREAYTISQSTKVITPFGRHARRYGFNYRGGKPDDITLIVSKVTTEDKREERIKNMSRLKEEESAVQENNKTSSSSGPSFFHKLLSLRPSFSLYSRL